MSESQKPVIGEIKNAASWRAAVTRPLTVTSGRLKKLPKYIKLAGILVTIIFVGFLAWKGFAAVKQRTSASNRVCINQPNGGILGKAALLLLPNQSSQLKTVVDQVLKTKRFDQDPNCLNIITTYYINILDKNNAIHYFDKLSRVYKPQEGFDPALGPNAKSYDTLKSIVEVLKNSQGTYKYRQTFKLKTN